MYVALGKEMQGIGSIKGLNLVAIRPMIVYLTNHSFRVVA
jgi:hypothetical protein